MSKRHFEITSGRTNIFYITLVIIVAAFVIAMMPVALIDFGSDMQLLESHRSSRAKFRVLKAHAAVVSVAVTLQPQVATPITETVSFAVPFPKNTITDAGQIAVFDDSGAEIPAYVESLVPWREVGSTGIRSALVQFTMTFPTSASRTVTLKIGAARTKNITTKTPVVNTLIESTGVQGPKILAIIPADWLSSSWIAGPQVPASKNIGSYAQYETWISKYFDGVAGSHPGVKDYNLNDFEPWLYDRVTVLYKNYIRTGNSKYLKEAYRSANLYRQNIWTQSDCPAAPSPCIGIFKLKEPNPATSYPDPKYSYSEGPALHYMLTGDDRFLQTIRDVTKAWDRYELDTRSMLPAYKPGQGYTERNISLGWLGYLHAYEILGRPEDLTKVNNQATDLFNLQNAPSDGFPPDGCWRHYSNDHGEGGYVLGCSPWMSSIMVDAIYKYYLLTGDNRAIASIQKFVDWLNKYGLTKQPYGDPPITMPWYYATAANLPNKSATYKGATVALEPSFISDGAETAHNMEMAYMFAMGYWASGKTNVTYLNRVNQFFPTLSSIGGNLPPRLYNWVLRDSSQFLYFLDSATPLSGAPIITPGPILTSTKFSIGDRLVVTPGTSNAKVRATPSLTGALLWAILYNWEVPANPLGDTNGTVIEGPVRADDLWWWKVSFDRGITGWIYEDVLDRVSGTSPPPPLPGPSAPTVTLTSSASSITAGSSATLTWSSTNATSCTASSSWSGAKATSGSQSVTPASTATYTLTCTGSGGSTPKSVTVTVTAPAPPPAPGPTTLSFNAITGAESGLEAILEQWKADETVRQAPESLWWWPWSLRAFDYDLDGDLDLLIGHHGMAGGMLLRNTFVETGKVEFYDATAEVGRKHWEMPGADGAPALWDFDGDGRVDIAGFTDEPPAGGMPSIKNVANNRFDIFGRNVFYPMHGFNGRGLFDFEGDGDLDVEGQEGSDFFRYIYDSNTGTFTAQSLGKREESPPSYVSQDMKDSLQSALQSMKDRNLPGTFPNTRWYSGDFNKDGRLDALWYIWWIFGPAEEQPARYCLTQADGICVDQTTEMGLPKNGLPVHFWTDLTGDGYVDMLVDVSANAGFYVNNGDGTFTLKPGDLTNVLRSAFTSLTVRDAFPQDLDNDGDLDLIVYDRSRNGWVLHNKGNGDFVSLSGKDAYGGYPVMFSAWTREPIAVGDYNNDGLLDLAIGGIVGKETGPWGSQVNTDLTLFLNTTPNTSNYIDVSARIPEPTFNPFAVGGSVSVYKAGTMASGAAAVNKSVLSNGQPVRIGLGSATSFDLRVTFPSGVVVEKFNLTTINTNLVITPAGGFIPPPAPNPIPIPLPTPIITLTATPSALTVGGSATLSWSATSATSCTASGAWSGAKTTSGSQTVTPASTATYTLTCTGSGGSTPKSVTVTVVPVGVPVPTPTPTPTPIPGLPTPTPIPGVPTPTPAPGATPTPSAAVFTKDLVLGSTDPEVTVLQTFLATDRTIYPEGAVTGYFDTATRSAVGRFQLRYGLPYYLAVESSTRARLNQLYAEGGGILIARSSGTPSPSSSPSIGTGISNITFRTRAEGTSNLNALTFTFRLFKPGLSTPSAVFTASGSAINPPASANITSGSYDIEISSRYFLKKRNYSVYLSSGADVTLATLPSGDLNEDQVINSLDWSIMSPRWLTSDPLSDINKDGKVNTVDFSILSNNWSRRGE